NAPVDAHCIVPRTQPLEWLRTCEQVRAPRAGRSLFLAERPAPVVTEDYGWRIFILVPPCNPFGHAPLSGREERRGCLALQPAGCRLHGVAGLLDGVDCRDPLKHRYFGAWSSQLAPPVRELLEPLPVPSALLQQIGNVIGERLVGRRGALMREAEPFNGLLVPAGMHDPEIRPFQSHGKGVEPG